MSVDDNLTTLALDAAVASGKYGSEECLVAIGLEVVGQEIVGSNTYVVGHTGKVLVVYRSVDNTTVAVAVHNVAVGQSYFVGHQFYGAGFKGVGGVQWLDVHGAIGNGVTLKVNFTQITEYPDISINTQIGIAHETAAETLNEFSTRVVCLDVQVDIIALRRYISVNVCA